MQMSDGVKIRFHPVHDNNLVYLQNFFWLFFCSMPEISTGHVFQNFLLYFYLITLKVPEGNTEREERRPLSVTDGSASGLAPPTAGVHEQ